MNTNGHRYGTVFSQQGHEENKEGTFLYLFPLRSSVDIGFFPGKYQLLLPFVCFETSEELPVDRSGVSAERRKPQEIEESGFLPKAATPVLQRSRFVCFAVKNPCLSVFIRG